jgi:hypothetical protein
MENISPLLLASFFFVWLTMTSYRRDLHLVDVMAGMRSHRMQVEEEAAARLLHIPFLTLLV